MTTTALALTGLLALAGPSLEVPGHDLDKSLVPANTPFLVHVDIQGLLQTELVKAAMDMAGDDIREELELNDIEEELGINPFEDILSVTAFSTKSGVDGGALLVKTTSRIDNLVALAQQKDEYRTFREGGITLHGMDDDAVAYIHDGPTRDTRYVVLSDDKEQVLAAAAVLRGDAPSLASSRTPSIRMKQMAGAFLFVEVGDALKELTGHIPNSEIAGLAKRFSLQAGETRGRVFVKAELETSDGRGAENIANIVEGVLALARLAGGSEGVPHFALDLLDSIDVQVAGTAVRLSLDFDGRELLEELEQMEGDW